MKYYLVRYTAHQLTRPDKLHDVVLAVCETQEVAKKYIRDMTELNLEFFESDEYLVSSNISDAYLNRYYSIEPIVFKTKD